MWVQCVCVCLHCVCVGLRTCACARTCVYSVCLQRVFVHANHHTVCVLNLIDGPGWELSSSPSVPYFILNCLFIDDKIK